MRLKALSRPQQSNTMVTASAGLNYLDNHEQELSTIDANVVCLLSNLAGHLFHVGLPHKSDINPG